MKENYWRKSDKTAVNRSEFLSVLTELKAIYIESPYHLSSGKVNLTWVRMSDASQIDKGSINHKNWASCKQIVTIKISH